MDKEGPTQLTCDVRRSTRNGFACYNEDSDSDSDFEIQIFSGNESCAKDIDIFNLKSVSYDDVRLALETVQIPINYGRQNIRTSCSQDIRSICLGIVARSIATISRYTLKLPNLTRLLVQFGLSQIPDKSFSFTSIQINQDFSSGMHIDKSNLGKSFAIGELNSDFQFHFIIFLL